MHTHLIPYTIALQGVKLSQMDHQLMFHDLIFEDCCVPPTITMLDDKIFEGINFVPIGINPQKQRKLNPRNFWLYSMF